MQRSLIRKWRRDEESTFANVEIHLLDPQRQSKHHAVTNVDSVGVIEHLTFADVARQTARWAQLLRENGLQPGDRVLVLAGREWAWRSALLGVLRAGGVAVPCPASLPVEEIHAIVADAGAGHVISILPRPDLVEPEGPAVFHAAGLDAIDASRALQQPAHESLGNDVALILYARSAAGLRGAVHTHASLIAQADAGSEWLGIGEDEPIWCSAVDGSAESIWLLLAGWHEGANIVNVELELGPEDRLDLLRRLGAAAVWFSDEEYGSLAAAAPAAWIDGGPFSRALLSDERSSGATAFAKAVGAEIAAVFGLAELGVVAGWPAGAEGEDTARAARPLPGIELAVVGEQGTRLPAGLVGDIVVRGDAPSLITGYAGSANGVPRADAWFLFGWRGSLDTDGLLRLTSRSSIALEPVEPRVEAERRRREEEEARELAEAADAERARREAAAAEERRREEEARRRAEQEARERAHAEAVAQAVREAAAEERRRADEAERARREAAAAEERRRAEEEQRREEERRREEEARRRAEQEAREREQAEAAARAEREADERRRADEEQRREEERRQDEEASRRAEEETRRLAEAAAAAERLRADRDAREAAAAVERRRAEEERREEERRREEQARRRAEQEARERAHAEAVAQAVREAAAEERRRADEAERARREAAAAEERRRAEQEAREREQAEAAARAEREADERRRADEEQRREEERRQDEEARRRAEQASREREQAEATAAADREAAAAAERRRVEAVEKERRRDADGDGHVAHEAVLGSAVVSEFSWPGADAVTAPAGHTDAAASTGARAGAVKDKPRVAQPAWRHPGIRAWRLLAVFSLLANGALLAGYFVARPEHSAATRTVASLAHVPDVVNQAQGSAVAKLHAAGFKSRVTTVPGSATAGVVIREIPAAGTKVRKGSAITLRVSVANAKTRPLAKGVVRPLAKRVIVPSVFRLKVTAAQRKLTAAGLRARIWYVASQLTPGQVTGQSPAAGVRVRRWTKVILAVSRRR